MGSKKKEHILPIDNMNAYFLASPDCLIETVRPHFQIGGSVTVCTEDDDEEAKAK